MNKFCVILAIILFSLNYFTSVDALFGNSHFYLCKNVIESFDKSLSEECKAAFLSGAVYADIGRFQFDKKAQIDSDSNEFVMKMKENIETLEEKWFVRGFEMHIFQDNKTRKFLNDIFNCGDYSSTDYIKYCGFLDSYFTKKIGGICSKDLRKFNFKQISTEFNVKRLAEILKVSEDKVENFIVTILNKYCQKAKNKLITYNNLTKRTYHSLGLEVNLDNIEEQSANIMVAFIVAASVFGKDEISKEFSNKIEEETSKLIKLCLDKLRILEMKP